MSRIWRADALLAFPRLVESAPDGGLPPQMTFRSLIPQRIESDVFHHPLRLQAVNNHPLAQQIAPHEPVLLTAWFTRPTPDEALALASPIFESIVDYLSFQTHQAIRVAQLEFLDVTPPVAVGDTREGLLFPAPDGYAFPKFQHSVHLGPGPIATVIALTPPPGWEDEHTKAARDWYIKGLAATNNADRFMFCWVAMEVMYDQSRTRIFRPPYCRKGHALPIVQCTECDSTNEQVSRGVSVQKFLEDDGGLAPETARGLWRLRQMFHGDVAFEAETLDRLVDWATLMQSVALHLLKSRLGIPATSMPAIEPTGPFISALALTWLRHVTELDLS